MTIGEQIIVAAAAAIGAEGKPAGLLSVDRDRTSEWTQEELAAADLMMVSEEVTYADTGDVNVPAGAVQRTLTFVVGLRWGGTQASGDAYRRWAVKQICANSGTLGGLAGYTREVSSKWAVEPSNVVLQGVDITFQSVYFTDAEDMEIPG
jgi:hypothetical protein